MPLGLEHSIMGNPNRKIFRDMISELKKKNIKKLDSKILDKLLKKHFMDPDTMGEDWQIFVDLLKMAGITLSDDLRKTNIINDIIKEAKKIESANNLIVEQNFDLSVTDDKEKPIDIPVGEKIQLINRHGSEHSQYPDYVTIRWLGKEYYAGDWNTQSKFHTKLQLLPWEKESHIASIEKVSFNLTKLVDI